MSAAIAQIPGTATVLLSGRELAMLRAVQAGRATISHSQEPDLFIDGVSCGDQFTAHLLAHRGLIRPERPGSRGELRPAELTPAGQIVLADAG
ncbi:hypothetical protein ACIA8G_29225 [Lentzea sp. NPDC051213]|uniref:hypothetical protein n=1 Tax=Lentzea sp. NPDC051213 TaxID=3364126 RepID=UPI0037A4EEBE